MYGTLGLTAGAEGRLGLLDQEHAVDHRAGVGVGLRRHQVHLVDDGGGRQRPQRRQRRGAVGRDARSSVAKATPSASADGEPAAPGWLMCRIEIGPRERPPPDWTIALWNSPLASGDDHQRVHRAAAGRLAEDRDVRGSPPNAAALRFTHCSAAS